jgi:hypothetical protein
MRYCIAILSFALISGCEHVSPHDDLLPAACLPINDNLSNIEDIDVLVVLNQTGGYIAIKACPDRAFSVDFSQSQLYTRPYSSLLNHLVANGVLGIASTEMRISGTIRRTTGTRDTMVVTRIINYRLR